MARLRGSLLVAFFCIYSLALLPHAEAADEGAAPVAPLGPRPPAAPAAYSLPWQLRPAAIATVVRSDSSIAFNESLDGSDGTTLVSLLSATYAVTPEFAPLLRWGLVTNDPGRGVRGTALLNPVVGGTYLLRPHRDLRLGLFLAAALPFGEGGGDSPDAGKVNALSAGNFTRAGLDASMFATNYLAIATGLDLAWVRDGFTVQLEANLFQYTRLRGEDVAPDASRTSMTYGLHLGWFPAAYLSLGGEVRLQLWLSTPRFVERDPSFRETLSFAVGPRAHLKLGKEIWFRPGLSYAQGLDDPLLAGSFRMLQFDLPVAF